MCPWSWISKKEKQESWCCSFRGAELLKLRTANGLFCENFSTADFWKFSEFQMWVCLFYYLHILLVNSLQCYKSMICGLRLAFIPEWVPLSPFIILWEGNKVTSGDWYLLGGRVHLLLSSFLLLNYQTPHLLRLGVSFHFWSSKQLRDTLLLNTAMDGAEMPIFLHDLHQSQLSSC